MAKRGAAKRKQPTVVKVRQRRMSGLTHFRKVPITNVTNYSEVLLRQIRHYLGRVISFTIDDLCRLPTPEFDQVAGITRYRSTATAVAYLLQQGRLVRKKFPDLCLPEHADEYRFDETTVSIEYAGTIIQLVQRMPINQPFTIMQVVSLWRTDPQLTLDSKRKAMRNAMPRLVRQKVCTKVGGFEYVRGDQS